MTKRGERRLSDEQSAAIRKALARNHVTTPTEIAKKLGLNYRQVASSGPYRDHLKYRRNVAKTRSKIKSGKFMSRSIAEAVKRAENTERAKEVSRVREVARAEAAERSVPEEVGESNLMRYKRKISHPMPRTTLIGLVGRMKTKHEVIKALADEMLADICFLQRIIGK